MNGIHRKPLADGVTLYYVPRMAIQKVDFLKLEDPAETILSAYGRLVTKPALMINGGLFNMSTGENVMSFTDEGKELNYRNNFEGLGILNDTPDLLKFGRDDEYQWRDFMTGFPVLVRNGKAEEDFGTAEAQIGGERHRQALGITSTGSVLVITCDANTSFKTLANYFVENKAQYAINLDGGGSVLTLLNGAVDNRPTEYRKIDNAFCVYLTSKITNFELGKYKVKETSELYSSPGEVAVTGEHGYPFVTSGVVVTVTELHADEEGDYWGLLERQDWVPEDVEQTWLPMSMLEQYTEPTGSQTISDIWACDSDAQTAIRRVVDSGIMSATQNGPQPCFYPYASVDRSDLAVIISRLIDYLKK